MGKLNRASLSIFIPSPLQEEGLPEVADPCSSLPRSALILDHRFPAFSRRSNENQPKSKVIRPPIRPNGKRKKTTPKIPPHPAK